MRVRTRQRSWWGALALAAAVVSGTAAHLGARQEPVPLSPERAAFMRAHFGTVMSLHAAVVRGDVALARSHAREIADRHHPLDLPAAAEPYLDVMRRTAARAAGEDELEDLAAMSAAMLAACGDCHRAAGVMPSAPPPPPSAVTGGAVGHMLEHQRAVDLMVQGLTMPSESLWVDGAKALAVAPMHRDDLPRRDAKLTRDILETERRVHELAARASGRTEMRSRIYYYSEIVQSCGSCHALHVGVWGPDRR
jgi:mono/diheme cytochrome c family protein